MARVGGGAFALGFAGLLPQAVAVAAIAAVPEHEVTAAAVAIGYTALILSFLGGMWWGFAMRRERGQARLAAVAVLPSLAAFAIVGSLAWTARLDWTLVAIGVAVLMTLPVDRHLANTGEAPQGWMRLRVPLSVGLGGLAILAGVLVA